MATAPAPPSRPPRRFPAASTAPWFDSRVLAAVLAFGVVTSLGFADGGLFPRAWRLGTIALAAAAAAALLARRRVSVAPAGWAAVGSLAALAGWTAASGWWATNASAARLHGERTLLYAALVAAVLVAVDRAELPYLLGGTVAGIATICAYALGEYLLAKPPLDPFEGALLHRPLGYANALGIFAAVGAVVSSALSLGAATSRARVAAALPLALLVPALALTSSRGAWLALAAAVGWLVAARLVSPRAGLAVLAAGAVAAVVAPVAAGDLRRAYWRVAWDAWLANPFLGGGAGTYAEEWLAHGLRGSFTRTAHSLYLQTLAELGPLGLVLVVVALGLPLLALRRRRDPVVAAAGAGFAAYVLHTGIDWDWELPAATAAGLLCGAGVLVGTRPAATPALTPRLRGGAVAVLLAVIVFAAIRLGAGARAPFGP